MSNPPGPRRPISGASDPAPRVHRLPDRTRAVAESPELDAAVSRLMELARLVKVRRHRGPLTSAEADDLLAAVDASTDAFADAVRWTLGLPDD